MEQTILGTEGQEIAKKILACTPLEEPSRVHTTGPDDWGDDGTRGLLVRRKREDDALEDKDWGQWAGMQRVRGCCRPTIVLRRCGDFDGVTSEEAAADIMAVFSATSQEAASAAMRASANKTPIVGVTCFDSVEEMRRAFYLD